MGGVRRVGVRPCRVCGDEYPGPCHSVSAKTVPELSGWWHLCGGCRVVELRYVFGPDGGGPDTVLRAGLLNLRVHLGGEGWWGSS